MDVTYEAVAEVIAKRFVTDFTLYDNALVFYVSNDRCHLEVTVALMEIEPEEEDDPVTQMAQVIVGYCDEESYRLDYPKMTYVEMLKLCSKLQCAIDWATLTAFELPGKTDVSMFRSIDITAADLVTALEDGPSEFVKTIERLLLEADDLSQMFLSVSKGLEVTADNAELYSQPVAGYA